MTQERQLRKFTSVSDWTIYITNHYTYCNKVSNRIGSKQVQELKAALNEWDMQCSHCEMVEKSQMGSFYRIYFKDCIGAALFKIFEEPIIKSLTR
jgi:hypothetical protein